MNTKLLPQKIGIASLILSVCLTAVFTTTAFADSLTTATPSYSYTDNNGITWTYTPPEEDTRVPDSVTSIKVTSPSKSKVEVSWIPPASLNGLTFNGYTVYYSYNKNMNMNENKAKDNPSGSFKGTGYQVLSAFTDTYQKHHKNAKLNADGKWWQDSYTSDNTTYAGHWVVGYFPGKRMSTTIDNLTPGCTLYIKIRANALSGNKKKGYSPRWSEWSDTQSIKIASKAASPAPKQATSVKLKSKSAGKVKLTWKASKVKGLTKQTYTVRYSYDKSMKNAKTKTVKAKSLNLSNLRQGKKLYAQIRVNAKYNGKTLHSKWSTKKTITIKA